MLRQGCRQLNASWHRSALGRTRRARPPTTAFKPDELPGIKPAMSAVQSQCQAFPSQDETGRPNATWSGRFGCRAFSVPITNLAATDKPGREKRSAVSKSKPYLVEMAWIFGERDGIRTHDLLIKSQLLYRLSYALPRAQNAALEIARNIGRVPRPVNRKNTGFQGGFLNGFQGSA